MLRAAALQRRRPVPSRIRSRSGAVLWLALAALLLQSLAPPGYMHGSADSGWPVVLCPEGLPAGFLESAHGHHEHQHHGTGSGSSGSGLGDHCSLSGMLDQAALQLPAAFDADVAVTGPTPVIHYAAPRLALRPRANHTRAPPIPA